MAVWKSLCSASASFSVEFHQSIQVANVFLTISETDKNIDILITKRYIQISSYTTNNSKSSSVCRYESSKDTFLPATTSGLSGQYFHISKDSSDEKMCLQANPRSNSSPLEVTFRIHINENIFTDHEDDTCYRNSRAEVPAVQIHNRYDLLCKTCGHQLNRSPLVFKRVLEKPSSDWQDLASEWFCHRHGDADGIPSGILQTDLMFSSNRLFLHPDLISVKEAPNGSTMCSRCNTHLGFQNESRLLNETNRVLLSELMVYSVIFRNLDDTLIPEEQNSVGAIETVNKIIRDQMEPIMMCKLCLESKGLNESGGSLLLWVMDNKLLRFHSTCPLTRGVQTVPIEPIKVIRVLYSLAEEKSDLASKWRKDFSVDTQSVEDCVLWPVVDHLLDSTRTLPSSHRVLDDLWIGFLPCEERTVAVLTEKNLKVLV